MDVVALHIHALMENWRQRHNSLEAVSSDNSLNSSMASAKSRDQF